ncbi:MAG: hypothetical protein Q7T61_15460 [Caulobacter sp.]|nr:hypothetical protein [Caulobacter sp.]
MRKIPFQAAACAALILAAALSGCGTASYVAADGGVRSDLIQAPR